MMRKSATGHAFPL